MLRSSGRKAIMCLTGGVAALLVAASASFACASLALLEVTPGVVKPGQEVDWKGTFFIKDEPVVVRWNALDGPVLATGVPPSADNGLHGNWRFVEGRLTIPGDVKAGSYILVATQNPVKGSSTWGVPARTVVQVSDGMPVVGQAVGQFKMVRPDNLLSEDSIPAASLVVVALGAAGVAMFTVGAALAIGARRPSPRRAPVFGADGTQLHN